MSRSAHDQVRDKVPSGFMDLGAHHVKNIDRPLEVFGLAPASVAALPVRALPPPPGAAWSWRDRRVVAAAALVVALGGGSGWALQRASPSLPQVVAPAAGAIPVFTPEQVRALTKAAAIDAADPLTQKIADLSKELGVTQGAARTMLRILGEQD